jgi:hypothetical protein
MPEWIIGTECECDIHLSYYSNELVNSILDAWKAREIVHEKRINKQ